MTPTALQTIVAGAALRGLAVTVTHGLASMVNLSVTRGHGPRLRYLSCDGLLRSDPTCPAGHCASAWATQCDALASDFEGLL